MQLILVDLIRSSDSTMGMERSVRVGRRGAFLRPAATESMTTSHVRYRKLGTGDATPDLLTAHLIREPSTTKTALAAVRTT